MNKSLEFISKLEIDRHNHVKGLINTEISFKCKHCLSKILIAVEYELVEESFKIECLCGKDYIITKVNNEVYLFLIKKEKITSLKAIPDDIKPVKEPSEDIAIVLGTLTVLFLIGYIIFRTIQDYSFLGTTDFGICIGLALILFFAVGFKLQDYE